MKFIYEKEKPTEKWISKEKVKIAGTESKEKGMSNGSETKGKNKQEKRELNEQERREENGDGDIIMIKGREANSEEESKEEGKRDGSVIVKVPLEGGKIEEMSFDTSEEAWVWLGDLSTKFRWKWEMKKLNQTVINLENRKYKLPNEKLQQVLIETVKFIASNTAKFRKRLKQLSAEEIGKIIDKDREKVRQSKKKLKGNTDKMLEAKKSNTISKTILMGKEKSSGAKNSGGVPPPSSSTGVPPPSSSTGVQSVPPFKGVFDGVPGSQAKIATQKKNITSSQNQKNATSFSNSDKHKFSTFSFGSHSGNGQRIADSPFPSWFQDANLDGSPKLSPDDPQGSFSIV